jgi:hypothetical protein
VQGGPGYVPVSGTNGLAIGALVAAFVFAPAGIVLAIMAKSQIRRTGEDGDGLATAALIISILAIVFYVIAFAAVLNMAHNGPYQFNNGPGFGGP